MPIVAIIRKLVVGFFLLTRHSVACKMYTVKDFDIVDEDKSFGLSSIAKDSIIVHPCSTHKVEKMLKT